MTTKEALQQARKKISTPETWTQGVLARNKFGNEVPSDCEYACSFCAMGAIESVTKNEPAALDISAKRAIRKELERQNDARNISGWNDYSFRTHAEVLSVFDSAIEAES